MADISQWISQICPSCGANLKMAPEAERITCPFCQNTFVRDINVIHDDPNKIDYPGDTIQGNQQPQNSQAPQWDYSSKFKQTADFKPTSESGTINEEEIKEANPQDQILEEEIDKLAKEVEDNKEDDISEEKPTIDLFAQLKQIPLAKMVILGFAAFIIIWLIAKAFTITGDFLSHFNSYEVEDIYNYFE